MQNEEGEYLFFLLKLLLILLLLFTALILIFLLIPFYYYIDLKYNEVMVLNCVVEWFKMISLKTVYNNDTGFSLKKFIFNKETRLKSNKMAKGKKRKINKDEYHKKRAKHSLRIKEVLDKDFIAKLVMHIKKVIETIKPKQFNIELAYGHEDPYITGSALGFIYFLKSFLPHADFNIQPVFDQETVDFKMIIAGKITLGIILIIAVKFIMKKSVRNKLKSMRKVETFS